MTTFDLDAACVGDGQADDWDAGQPVFDAAEAHAAVYGRAVVKGSRRFRTRKAFVIGSGTILDGGGTFATDQAINVGSKTNNDLQILRNRNNQPQGGMVIDHDITIARFNFDYGDTGQPPEGGGGRHAVELSFVRDPQVSNATIKRGMTAVGFRGCINPLAEKIRCYEQINSFVDAWEGSGAVTFRDCWGETTHHDIAQGFQCSGAGNFGQPTATCDVIWENLRAKGVRNPVNQGSAAFSLNAAGWEAGAKVRQFIARNLYAEDCDVGVHIDGDSAEHDIDITMRGVTMLPVYFREHNGVAPRDVRLKAKLIDCGHRLEPEYGVMALAHIIGANHEIDLDVIQNDPVAYQRLAYFLPGATNSLLRLSHRSPSGTIARVLDQGVGNSVIDGFRQYAKGTYTPQLTFGGGAAGMIYGGRAGYYERIGNLVHFDVAIQLSAKGSSLGNVKVSLPFKAAPNAQAGSAVGGYQANMIGMSDPLTGGIGANAWHVTLRLMEANGTVDLTHANFNNNTWLYFSGSYLCA